MGRSGRTPNMSKAITALTALAVLVLKAACFRLTGQDQPADFAPRWGCTPWGANHVQDENWPLLMDAYRSEYPAYKGLVVVQLNGDHHAWKKTSSFNESQWTYSAIPNDSQKEVKCTPIFISSSFSHEVQFVIGCPLGPRVTSLHFKVDTHDVELGWHEYLGVNICKPPLTGRYKLVMNALIYPNRIDRFWLVPWVKVHQALGAQAVVIYVITDYGDIEYGRTWNERFSPEDMEGVLNMFHDLKNVVFVPFTMSTNNPVRPPYWNTQFNQNGMAAHILYALRGTAKWVGLIDVDEYFWPGNETTSLLQLVSKYEKSPYAGLAGVWESYAGAGWTANTGSNSEVQANMAVTGSILDCTSKGRQTAEERWPPGNGQWDPPCAYKQLVRLKKAKMFKTHTFQHAEPFKLLDPRREAAVRHYQHQCACFFPPCDLVDTSSRDYALALGITPCTIDPRHPACKPAAAGHNVTRHRVGTKHNSSAEQPPRRGHDVRPRTLHFLMWT